MKMQSDEFYGVGEIGKAVAMSHWPFGNPMFRVQCFAPGQVDRDSQADNPKLHGRLVKDFDKAFPNGYVREIPMDFFRGIGGTGKQEDPLSASKAAIGFSQFLAAAAPVDENGWPDLSNKRIAYMLRDLAVRFESWSHDDTETRNRMLFEREETLREARATQEKLAEGA